MASSSSSSLSLLAHITYHDSNSSNLGSQQALKTSGTWRRFCYDVVMRQLDEMETAYSAFAKIDVIFDVNAGHGFLGELRAWPSTRPTGVASRVSIRVDVHERQKLSHPFQLAWMHRASMAAKLELYDWFMTAEADTFVPARALAAQVALASTLYDKHQMLLGFVRLCNDTQARSFYSDITKPAPRKLAKELPGIGTIVPPQNTYAAVWAYPRSIMRGFMKSEDWDFRSGRAMRERAAWGWRHYPGKIVTLVDDPSLRIYHVGKSGPYLVRVRGHNTLPASQLVA